MAMYDHVLSITYSSFSSALSSFKLHKDINHSSCIRHSSDVVQGMICPMLLGILFFKWPAKNDILLGLTSLLVHSKTIFIFLVLYIYLSYIYIYMHRHPSYVRKTSIHMQIISEFTTCNTI